MNQNDRVSARRNGRPENLPSVYQNLVQKTRSHRLHPDQLSAGIQQQDLQVLGFVGDHFIAHYRDNSFRSFHKRQVPANIIGNSAGQSESRLQCNGLIASHAPDPQLFQWSPGQAVEGPKVLKQPFPDLQGRRTLHTGSQENRQQFRIPQRFCTVFREAFPGALTYRHVLNPHRVGHNQEVKTYRRTTISSGVPMKGAGLQRAQGEQSLGMTIGVPREIKEQEYRVALLPSAAYQLTRHGHRVVVEKGAGVGSGFPDSDYANAGAILLESHAGVFEQAELIVKVKEPLPSEFPLLRPGHLLFTYLHLAANKTLTEALMRSGLTALAYESVEHNGRLPLLEPMSEIAGRMSVIVGGHYLAKHNGGSGMLLGGVPGVLPGKVVVLGGGVSGVNAARMATGVGADVTILEVDIERMRFLDITLHTAHTLYSNESHLQEILPEVDLLIGAVLVPGARAPKLVTRQMLRQMRPGSVLVDIAIDQGGCAETSRATTHHDPVFVEEGVIHYCVANMPGAYARTATQALTNATFPYIEALADHGLGEAIQRRPALLGGINIAQGKLTSKPVAEAHGLPCTPTRELLKEPFDI